MRSAKVLVCHVLWSLEARPPLLDCELVEFVLGLPSEVRSPSGTLKGMLIDAVRDLLPDEIVAARKKVRAADRHMDSS